MSDDVERVSDVLRHRRCVWLDDVGGGWDGRSTIAWLDDDDPSLTFDAAAGEVRLHTAAGSRVVGSDVFEVLRRMRQADGGDWYGYLGYAARTGLRAASDPRFPDAVWMRPSHALRVEPPLVPVAPEGSASGGPATEACPEPYREAFDHVQRMLRRGETYETNLTYRVALSSGTDPVAAYLRLRGLNPAPHAAFLRHDVGDRPVTVLSASPERFVRIGPDRVIEARPIKGTTPRGSTPAEDEQQLRALQDQERFVAENLMILDLVRNDLGAICELGSVVVPQAFEVESYAAVHQLVSTVRGRLRADVDVVEAIRAIFPAGSMTGAPKERTMQIIDRVEWSPRGVYSGAFGVVSAAGEADLGVTIRSMVTDGRGHWTLGTGGGITARSSCAEEWAESVLKTQRLVEVLDG